jgi:hypothetical protein
MSIQALSPVRLTPVRFGNDHKTYDESDPTPDPNQLVGKRGTPSETSFEQLRDQIKGSHSKHDEPQHGELNQNPSPTSREGRYISAGKHFMGFIKSFGIMCIGGGATFMSSALLAPGKTGKLGKYIAFPVMVAGLALSLYGAALSKYHQIAGIYQAVRGVFAKNAQQAAR